MGYDPMNIWKGLYKSYAKGKHKDVHYKFTHRIIKSKELLSRYMKIKIHCEICPKVKETMEHIFLSCPRSQAIWTYVHPKIREILRTDFTRMDLILNKFPPNISIPRMQMAITIIEITMHTLWIDRNRILFERKEDHPTIEQSKHTIKRTFNKILENKFREYMPHGLVKFQNKFCHTPSIRWVGVTSQVSL